MPRAGLRKVSRYSGEFKATAVKLSSLSGVLIQDVARELDLSNTLAIEVDAILQRCRALDERFLGKTIAIMVNEYEQAQSFNDRQLALAKAVELLEKLMTRLSPWYVRYEKLLTFFVSSVGIISGILTIITTVLKVQ